MRLYFALFRQKHMPNGHMYRGKQRIIREVTLSDAVKLKNNFEIEEQNMFYLRHPYLTQEQSAGHAKALGKHDENYWKTVTKRPPFKDNIKIEDVLGHLRYREAWD